MKNQDLYYFLSNSHRDSSMVALKIHEMLV